MAQHEAGGDASQRRPAAREQHSGPPTDSVLSMGESERKQRDMEERQTLVLWRRPLLTLHYFVLELLMKLRECIMRLGQQRRTAFGLLLLLLLLSAVYQVEGTHQQHVHDMEKQFLWCAYWVGLGILSSVGLGTGLHTFLLYLGPHIAAVTVAAYECGSVDFPEPPYPEQIICPRAETPVTGSEASHVGVVDAPAPGVEEVVGAAALHGGMSLWTIISKVRLEACMWGAGTAIGELPPYFMARAARLSGKDPDDEDYLEFEEMLEQAQTSQDLATRAKLAVHKLIQSVGFFGILACASIPNPLFDLAGITCGHFLVPFWTFFGATLIGKAVIKMHIQKLFVIITFSRHLVEQMVSFIGAVPVLGAALQKPLRDYLEAQRAKLHHSAGEGTPAEEENWLSWLFEKIVVVMVCFFVCSIVNSMAQSYAKRRQQEKHLEGKTE